jgi:acetyl/propionyl-CoA carboxylase alpha subunit
MQGNLVHLGEREGSLLIGNQKVIEEAPAPSLVQTERECLWQLALTIAKLFGYRNAGTVEFLRDAGGGVYFSEIKARIQIEHPLTEMLTRVDLVREQIRLAAGEPLKVNQSDVRLDGWAMQARISAQDPWNHMMPSPGQLRSVHLPDGPEVRTDTYAYSGCEVPPEYDPLIAKLIVWGQNRESSRMRLERALAECRVVGTATTLPLLQRLVRNQAFLRGEYDVESLFLRAEAQAVPSHTLRDLAAAVAVYYQRETNTFQPVLPERMLSGWHRTSRKLPE